MNSTLRAWALPAVSASLWLAGTSVAAVLDVSATVSSSVERIVDGQVVSSDSALEQFPGTATTLPMEARSSLTGLQQDTTGIERVDGAGLARALFNDPRLSDSPVPEDFGIDLSVFSNGPEVRYGGHATSTETREIRIGARELLRAPGTVVEILSQFYLDGAVVVWASSSQADLTGLEAQVSVQVVQERPQMEPAEVTVLEAVVRVVGGTNGQIEVQTNGAIGPDNLVSLDLADILPELDRPEIQRLQVVVFPNMVLSYRYPAVVDRTFHLRAVLDVQAVSVPGGSGVGVVFGVPFQALGEVVGTVIDETSGQTFQESVDAAVTTAPPPPEPLTGRPSLCFFPFGWIATGLPAGLMLVGLAGRARGRIDQAPAKEPARRPPGIDTPEGLR